MCFVLFFFFKQKTAYEMRISDWSSDVCSSDLRHRFDGTEGGELGFGRSFGHFILSLAWLLIGPPPAPNERGAGGDSALARIHHNHIDLNAREIRLYGEDHDGRGKCDVRNSGAPGPNDRKSVG